VRARVRAKARVRVRARVRVQRHLLEQRRYDVLGRQVAAQHVEDLP